MIFKAKIFVEGERDKKFLKDFVQYRFHYKLPEDRIESIGGKEALHVKKNQLLRTTESGLKNLVIIDANGSYDKSKSFLCVSRKLLLLS